MPLRYLGQYWYLVYAIASSIAAWLAYKFAPANGCRGPYPHYEVLMLWIERFLIFQMVAPLIALGIRYKDWPWNVVLGLATTLWALLMLIVAAFGSMCL